MQYAGTISVESATFEALLTDICRSYKAHGFMDIVLLGDSGGNQRGMERVADALNRRWSGEKARVHYLREYYFEDRLSYNYLKTLGITQIDKTPPPGEPQDRRADWRNGIHDDIYYEAQIAVQDPKLIRMEQRIKAGLFSLPDVEPAPIDRTIELDESSPSCRDHREGVRGVKPQTERRVARRSGDRRDSCGALPFGRVVLWSEEKCQS